MRGGARIGELGALPRSEPPHPGPGRSPLHLLPRPSPSQDGKTALDVAKEYSHTEVIKLLERYDSAYLPAQVCCAAKLRATALPLHTEMNRERYQATGT